LIPELLKKFEAFEIRATWATVGMLMASDRKQLLEFLPSIRPDYPTPDVDPYRLIETGELGRDEKEDPFHFAPSLLRQIRQTPGQEIGSHTFSHFYCEDDRVGAPAFEADLMAAQAIAERSSGQLLQSLVFPRNQVFPPYREIWEGAGLKNHRTNPDRWFWQGGARAMQRRRARLARLGDHYFPGPPSRIRFFRPYLPRFDRLGMQKRKVRRIREEMTQAARTGDSYHLWWHPHNLATHPQKNLEALDQILLHFRSLHEHYGMESRSMQDEGRPKG
jgi:peptidoglycan/xylan/chitin deacetylase (PgdA/CDA1 family)